MKAFARWGIALFGAAINLALTAALLLPELNHLERGEIARPEKTPLPPRLWSFRTDAVDGLVEELKAQREKVSLQEKELVTLLNHVNAERAELEKVRAGIEATCGEIEKRIVEIEESELKNLKSLAQTYAAMSPPAAVAILRELDENMSVKILSFMKADIAGPILGEMARTSLGEGEETLAKRAARITDKLRLLKVARKEKEKGNS